MHFIFARRRTGRTNDAIHWYLQLPESRIILVPNEAQKQHVLNLLRERYKNAPNQTPEGLRSGTCVATPLTIRNYTVGLPHKEVYVDNLETVLWSLFGNVTRANVEGATMELWHREEGGRHFG